MTTPTAIFKLYSNNVDRPCEYNAIDNCNELRKHLILWASNQATGYRTKAAIGHTKHHHDRCTAKADSFDFIVKYLEGMEIK